jgi:hypothetical protein
MANESPPAAALPGWLAPVLQAIGTLGVPTVIAGVLLYFVLFRLDVTLRVIEDSEDRRLGAIVSIKDSFTNSIDMQTRTFEKALDRQTDAFKQAIQANITAIETNRTLLSQWLQIQSQSQQRSPQQPPPP